MFKKDKTINYQLCRILYSSKVEVKITTVQ